MARVLENNLYPLPVYHYRVYIAEKATPVRDRQKLAQSTGSEFVGFSQIDGLSQERDTVRYSHGLSWKTGSVTQMGQYKPLILTLKRGLAPKRSQLTDWFQDGSEARDLEVQLLDPIGHASVLWKIYRAMPTKIDGPSFSAQSNEIALEQVSLTAETLRVIFL